MRPFVQKCLGGLVAGLAALAPLAGAQAQGFDLPAGVRITVGMQAIMTPKYEGSAKSNFVPVPIFSVSGLGGGAAGGGGIAGILGSFEARGFDDLSLALYKSNGFSVGPLTGFRAGREEKDGIKLKGLGDIDGGVVAGGFARYDFGQSYIRTAYIQQVTGSDTGAVVRFSTGTRIPVSSTLLLKADVNVDYADEDYNSAFFGVTPAQSAKSGVLKVYQPGAGFKSAGILLGTEYMLTKDWKLLATGGYTRLMGPAVRSPVIDTPERFEARLGASYSFDWR